MSTPPLDPHELLAQLRDDDQGTLVAQLTVQSLERRDPVLAEVYAAAALVRRFDRALVDRLAEVSNAGQGSAGVFDRLVSLSEVQRRPDGYFTLHDSVRTPLLRHWDASPDRQARARTLHQALATYFRRQHERALAGEQRLLLCADALREVNRDRYIQVSRAVDRQLTWPLADAIYHATASSPEDALRELVVQFNENAASGRLTACSAMVDSFRDAVRTFVARDAQQRLFQWATYFEARLFLSLEDFPGAEVLLSFLDAEGVVGEVLRIWVLDELAAAAQGLCQMDRALQLRERAVTERTSRNIDMENVSVALFDRGRCQQDLWDEVAAHASYVAALEAARKTSNATHAFNAITELAPELAASGRAAEAADRLLEALHLARTVPQLRANGALRASVTAFQVFVHLDHRQAETAYQEARALLPPSTPLGRVLDLENEYLDLLAPAGLLARARELEATIRTKLPETASPVRARSLLALARAAFARGDMGETLVLAEEVLRLDCRATVERRQVAGARTDAALACLELGRLDDAEGLLNDAADDWTAMGHRRGAAFVAIQQAELARRRGGLHLAEDLVEQGKVFCGTGAIAESEFEAVYAAILRWRGRWSESAEHALRAAEIALGRRRLGFAVALWSHLVVACCRAGDYAGARSAGEALERALAALADQAGWLPSADQQRVDHANAQAVAAVATRSSSRTAVLEGAARQLEHALAVNSQSFWYAVNLAYVQWELGNRGLLTAAVDQAAARAAGGPFAAAVAQLRSRLV